MERRRLKVPIFNVIEVNMTWPGLVVNLGLNIFSHLPSLKTSPKIHLVDEYVKLGPTLYAGIFDEQYAAFKYQSFNFIHK